MPWTASNTINSMKKKSLELRELFAEVANVVLAESGSEEDAIQAGLAAVAKKEGKVRVKKAVEAKPAPTIPPHLAAILALKAKRQQTEEQEISKAVRATTAALETTSEEINTNILFKQRNRLEADPDRSLVAVEWDKEGRLVLKFDDGEKLVSEPVPTQQVSQSSVAVINNIEPLRRMKEPTGFTSRMNSQISFDNTTRTFTISSAAAEGFEVWLHAISTTHYTDTVEITDVTGLHFIYYDYLDASLQVTQTPSPELFTDMALVAILYWRQDQQQAIYFADERHGITMDGSTHQYLHLTLGAQYRQGLGLYDFLVDQNGSSDLHCKFSCQDGRIADEDLEITIANNLPQKLQQYCTLPLFYRIGADSNWYRKEPSDMPLIKAGDVEHYSGALIAYNHKLNNQWLLSAVGVNRFVLVHVFATNDVNTPIVAVLGGTYQTKSTAREFARSEIKQLQGLPFLEFVELGTIIYQANETYTNTYKARIDSTDTGEDYVDHRLQISSLF